MGDIYLPISELRDRIDKECVNLCLALNSMSGITTIESCSGHGKDPYRIWFMPSSLDDLPPVLYWFDACHSGCYGWKVIVYTDCGMSPARFMIEGPVSAYDDAEKIARLIFDYLHSVTDSTPAS